MSQENHISRRSALRNAALLTTAAITGAVSQVSAQQTGATGLQQQMALTKRDHPPELWTLPPASIKAKPPFDLDDPIGNWHAVMKAASSLVGSRTYVASYQRTFICPVGKPAMPFFAGCGAWTHQLVTPPEKILKQFADLPDGTWMQLGLYTGVVLDPYTFKPVDQLTNPYTGKTIYPEDSVYAESYLILPGGGMISLERPELLSDRTAKPKPYLRSGKKLSFNLDALFGGEGPHQPRMDASWWTVNYDDLMNPDVPDVMAEYSWTGLKHARDRKWWGVDASDSAQLINNVYGSVAKRQADIEPIVQEYVFSKYPERI